MVRDKSGHAGARRGVSWPVAGVVIAAFVPLAGGCTTEMANLRAV